MTIKFASRTVQIHRPFGPLIILVLLLSLSMPKLSLPLLAQIQNQRPETIDALGTISGTVTDEDGNPLGGIEISSRAVAYDDSVTTDDAGKYTISAVGTGRYTIMFRDPDGPYVDTFYGDSSTIDEPQEVSIHGNNVIDINGVMVLGGTISGTILDTIPEPIGVPYYDLGPGYNFEIYRKTNDTWLFYKSHWLAFTTEAYATMGLPEGTYRICAYKWHMVAYGGVDRYGYECYSDSDSGLDRGVDIQVLPGQTTGGIDFHLGNKRDVATIAGTVTADDGMSLANVRVSASPTGLVGWPEYAHTDENGQYRLNALVPTTYTLTFHDQNELYATVSYSSDSLSGASSDEIAVKPSQVLSDINVALTRYASVSGVVTYEDGEIPNGVNIWLQKPGDLFSGSQGIGFVNSESGRYTVTHVVPGEYLIMAEESIFYDTTILGYYGGATLGEATFVNIDGTLTGYDFTIPELPAFVEPDLGPENYDAAILGQVVGADGGIPDIRVELLQEPSTPYPAPIKYTLDESVVTYAYTDKDGRYTIGGLPGGESYGVRFIDESGQYASAYYGQTATYGSRQDVLTARNQEIKNIDVLLGIGGTLAGTFTPGDGSFPANYEIVLLPYRELLYIPDQLITEQILTDENGGFSVSGIPPGDYLLTVLRPEDGVAYGTIQERMHLQIKTSVFEGETTIEQIGVTGLGAPLSLETIEEPQQSIFMPFVSQ